MSKRLEPFVFMGNNRGQYLPQNFAEWALLNPDNVQNFDKLEEDFRYLVTAGVEGDAYWDTWTHIEDEIIVLDNNQVSWEVYMNEGDCWLVPKGFDPGLPENEDWREFFNWGLGY